MTEVPQKSGFLCVDKPLGVSSFDIVAAYRRVSHIRKVGHAGTLDPQASGLLLLAFGQGTRLLQYLSGQQKTYRTIIRLGATTTTDDAEGERSSYQTASQTEKIQHLTPSDIQREISEHFLGMIYQRPSAYSAIHIDGQRAYDLARKGENVVLPSRPVTIYSFTIEKCQLVTANEANTDFLISANPHNHAKESEYFLDVTAEITCSTGTYIRSLGRDLGDCLGVGGYLTFLRRTQVGAFSVDQACTAHQEQIMITDRKTHQEIARTRAVLDEYDQHTVMSLYDVAKQVLPTITISDMQVMDIRCGRRICVPVIVQSPCAVADKTNLIAICSPVFSDQVSSIVKPITVFPLDQS